MKQFKYEKYPVLVFLINDKISKGVHVTVRISSSSKDFITFVKKVKYFFYQSSVCMMRNTFYIGA